MFFNNQDFGTVGLEAMKEAVEMTYTDNTTDNEPAQQPFFKRLMDSLRPNQRVNMQPDPTCGDDLASYFT